MSYQRKTTSHTRPARRRRQRRTFSLAPEVIEYVEQVQKTRDAPSLSAAFEAIVRERQEKEWMEKVNADTTAYYNSRTEEEEAEERAWAELVGRAMTRGDE